nr:serine/threonine protein kinase [Patulibacter sp. SYSU D01012]
MRQLGQGAMGTVWLAEHVTLGRQVALKLLQHGLADDPSFRDRFEREARLAARLDHPNVVPVYDAGTDPAGLWLTMRYVEGEDLRRRLTRARQLTDGGAPADGVERPAGLPPEEAVRIVEAVAAGLDHAHARGILHRDVKPGNVLLEEAPGAASADGLPPFGRVLLADFGLTKELDGAGDLTQTGMLLGSADYMAPEQIEARPLDARADVYALAAMLYVALTGRPPFEGATMAKLFAHVNRERPTVSAVVPDLAAFDAVIARGMAQDPEDRPASAGELAAAAREALAQDDPQATVAFPAPVAPRRPTPPGAVPPAPRMRDEATGERTRVAPPADRTRVAPTPPAGPRAARPGGGVPPVDPAAPPRQGASRWLLPGLAVAALLVALAVVVVLGLRPGDDGDDARADRGDRTTTRERTRTRTQRATTAQAPASPETTPTEATPPPTTTGPSPDGGERSVRGGGTLAPGAPDGDPGSGAPLPGDGGAATYTAPDGSWRALLAEPGNGWRSPTRTSQSGGALFRLRQRGPDGRLILVDHTPSQPARFDTGPGVLETRTLSGTRFGDVQAYRFKDARIGSIPECASLECVDVPLNEGEGGPGWGVLVAAPTPDEAWGLADRVARTLAPS